MGLGLCRSCAVTRFPLRPPHLGCRSEPSPPTPHLAFSQGCPGCPDQQWQDQRTDPLILLLSRGRSRRAVCVPTGARRRHLPRDPVSSRAASLLWLTTTTPLLAMCNSVGPCRTFWGAPTSEVGPTPPAVSTATRTHTHCRCPATRASHAPLQPGTDLMGDDTAPSPLRSSRPQSLWLRVAGIVPSSGQGCSGSPPRFHLHPVSRHLMSTFCRQARGPGAGVTPATRQGPGLQGPPSEGAA